MDTVLLNANAADRKIIKAIAERAVGLNDRLDVLEIMMDITAVHLNGTPLRLADMHAARDVDLMHDVLGINSHIDRSTGHIFNLFRPRFSVPTRAEALQQII